MREANKRFDHCVGECGRKFERGPRFNSRRIDDKGLCADCAPPSSTCAEGVRCDFSRIWRFDPDYSRELHKLKLCEKHKKLLTSRLREARKAAKAQAAAAQVQP